MREIRSDAEFIRLLIAYPDEYIVTAVTSDKRMFATKFQCPAPKSEQGHLVLAVVLNPLTQGLLGMELCTGKIESSVPQCFDCPVFRNKVGPEFKDLGEVSLGIWSRNQIPKKTS